MLQDNGMEILRHAAKYLHQRWLDEGNIDDYQAVNLLKWMFTADAIEPESDKSEIRTVQMGVLKALDAGDL